MRGPAGLTLVELLLVVTLLGLCAAALVGLVTPLGHESEGERRLLLRRLDRDWRAQAPVSVVVQRGHVDLVAEDGRRSSMTLPAGIGLLQLDGQPLRRLDIDAAGRSADFLIVDGARCWRCCGLTGALLDEQP